MDFRTAEQKAEFDSLFKSFLETFNKQFNQIRSIQIKINEQVKSIEVKNDKFFHEACARLSEPESPDRSSNSRSTPTSQTDIDDEKLLSSTGESEISQSTRDGTKHSFEDGKSFLSPILSPGIQYEAVTEDEFATGEPIAFTSKFPLFDSKAFSTGNAQTGSDVFGVSETHCTSVPDQLPIDQRLISQSLTSVDSNMPRSDSNLLQAVEYSPDEASVENVNPCLSDECSVFSGAKYEATLDTSVRHPSEFGQTKSVASTCLVNDICSSTQELSHFLIIDPPVCDETMHNASVLPPPIPRHGPDLQNDHFVSSEPGAERSKAQTLTSFSSLGKSDVGSFTQEAFIVTGPLPMPSRYGKDTRPNVSSGTNQVSEAIVAQILALSFPKHGPDENITSFVGTSVLRRPVLDLPFPKHGPDILAFFRQLTSGVITQALRSSQSVGRTSAIRMAEGREAYGRLRPVRRPWF